MLCVCGRKSVYRVGVHPSAVYIYTRPLLAISTWVQRLVLSTAAIGTLLLDNSPRCVKSTLSLTAGLE